MAKKTTTCARCAATWDAFRWAQTVTKRRLPKELAARLTAAPNPEGRLLIHQVLGNRDLLVDGFIPALSEHANTTILAAVGPGPHGIPLELELDVVYRRLRRRQ